MAQLFTDDFAGSGAPADPPWTTMTGTFGRSGGVLTCVTTPSGYAAMRRNDVTFSTAQYGEFIYGGESGGNNGIMLRAVSTGATLGGYYMIFSNSSHDVFIGKIVNRDTFTDFTSFGITASASDTIRAEIDGSGNITISVNGTPQGSPVATDGTYTAAGQVGIFSDNVSSTVTSEAHGGDLAAAGGSVGRLIGGKLVGKGILRQRLVA